MMRTANGLETVNGYIETRIGPNPLNEYMSQYQRHLEHMQNGASRWKCSYCGEEGRGISDVLSGRFKCFQCLYKEEYERAESDPTMVKRVRLWNLRAAREKRKIEEQLRTDTIFNMTNDTKEELASKLMNTIDLPVNSQ